MRKYKIKKLDLEMNLAPLIDVVFLLLIFFMVASTLESNEVKATLQLPQVNMEIENKKDEKIVLYIDNGGKVYMEDANIPWDNLQDYLQTKYPEFPTGIEVYADKEVDFEYIARLMAISHRAKIEQISFCLETENKN